MCKVDIGNFCIECGKYQACQKHNETKQLFSRIKDYEKELAKNPDNKETNQNLTQVKQKLEILQLDKAKGAQIRSRVKWVEEGERNTKYFCNLEKSRGKRKIITSLIKDSSVVLTEQNDIIEEQVSFYKNMYSKKALAENVIESTDKFIEKETFPRLDENDVTLCEGLVSLNETTAALKKLNNGSAPGSDGITIEFVKFFWSKLSNVITNSFNDSFNKGELSYTQRQGIITLLHKGKNLDRNILNNWRPITLTNSDYKILAKALAERLVTVIHKLVNDDQVGFIRGRNIATVIRSIDDVINYLNKTKKAGLLLAVDYSKAFDSISKTFIQHVFKVFGFGTDFQKWVQVLNNGCLSSINHGGWISEPFDIGCGIRQGCPFSPLGFVLAVELLAIKIRNSAIKGIELPSENNKVMKIKQMADDTTLFLRDKQDFSLSLDIIHWFERFSGLSLNMNKTKALRMGRTRENDNIPVTIVNRINILGIWFESEKMASTIKGNWEDRIDRMKQLIKEWSKRDLSIQGKIVVVKTFLVSQFTYVMQSIGLPHDVLQIINTYLYKFIWQKKYSNKKAFEKVKRKIMEADYNEGGLNMINMFDLQKYFYLQWAGKLAGSTHEQNWDIIPWWHLGKLTKQANIFYINSKANKVNGLDKIDNDFWTEVLKTFLDSKAIIRLEEVFQNNYQNQHIFNNELIKYKQKTLFFQKWQSKDIYQIKDIMHCTENRLLSLNEIIDKVGTNRAETIFEYNAMINSIPPLWIQWIQSGARFPEKQVNVALKFDTKPKYIKKILNAERDTLITCSVFFWQRKLNYCVNNSDWLRAIDVTKETRLRVLHWKILHNIYPTNIILNKMQVKENNKCSYCPNTVDFMEHFFFSCPIVREFWRFIENMIFYKTGTQICFSTTAILFGIDKTTRTKENYHFINVIILIGKMAVSIFKKTESSLTIQHIFERELKMRLDVNEQFYN